MRVTASRLPMTSLASRPTYSVMPTGAIGETIPRSIQQSFASPASGTVYLHAIMLPAGATITSITHASVGTGATTPTVQVFGLYDNLLARLRSTVDDGATAWAANALKTLNLTAPFTTTYEGLHYTAFLVAAATPPDVAAANSPVNSAVYSIAPFLRFAAQVGQTSLPATATLSANLDRIMYAYVS